MQSSACRARARSMRRGYLLLWFTLVSTGCTAILGLDAPTRDEEAGTDATPAGDTDHDGVADVADNCPNLANADQADTDRNAVGDACDGCVALALRAQDDDDGDGIGDAADS